MGIGLIEEKMVATIFFRFRVQGKGFRVRGT